MWPWTASEVVAACTGQIAQESFGEAQVRRVTTDSRQVSAGDLFVALRGERFDGHDFVRNALDAGATLALVEESWAGYGTLPRDLQSRCIRVSHSLQAFRAFARAFRARFPFPVVAIGGSNGKTTTKEMLASLLGGSGFAVTRTERSENGFLGVALTLCQEKHAVHTAPAALVLEIGIDEPGAMQSHLDVANPDLVLLTALGPEHLSGLGDWETAVREELLLFASRAPRIWQTADPRLAQDVVNAQPGDTVVLPEGMAWKQRKDVNVLRFALTEDEPTSTRVTLSWEAASTSTLPCTKWTGTVTVPLPGKHNAANLALAFATALSLGRLPRESLSGWAGFRPPAMRSRIETLPNGCTLYDDCYNASPASMEAALKVMQAKEWQGRPKVLVLGDMLELGVESKKWHLEILGALGPLANAHLCLFGNAMYDVYKALENQQEKYRERGVVATHLPPHLDPKLFLEQIPFSLAQAIVLVKGSRGMDLGRFVAALRAQCASQ